MNVKHLGLALVAVSLALSAFAALSTLRSSVAPAQKKPLNLYGLQLGAVAPPHADCDRKYIYTNCEIGDVSNRREHMACRVPLPAGDEDLGQQITVCIADQSRRIGRIIVDFPPKGDETSLYHLAVLERLNSRLGGKGTINYPKTGIAFGPVFAYGEEGQESIIAIASLLGMRVDLMSTESQRMLETEQDHRMDQQADELQTSAREKSHSFDLSL